MTDSKVYETPEKTQLKQILKLKDFIENNNDVDNVPKAEKKFGRS